MAKDPLGVGKSDTVTAPVMVAADTGFTGRLELRTARLVAADAFVGRAIENNGLSSRMESDILGNRRVYQITGSRDSVNRFVASLSGVWQSFDSAALQVDRPESSAAPVIVESVTPEQAAAIVAQNSTKASLDTAVNFAVMNRLAKNMPAGGIPSLMQHEPGPLFAVDTIPVPKPRETGPDSPARTTPAPVQGKTEVKLTIVLLNSR
jgi:hypothetical protein